MLTEGSLFAGIGGWTLACEKFGIKSLWASEIEKFPIRVMQQHFPQVKQLGDINKLSGYEIEPVDIITAGSPCQDFSVANGDRKGLQGERSGLFCKAIKILYEMRESTKGKQPRFFIFENVPGVLNCNGGMDYQEMLEEITESKIPMPDSGRWATAGMVRGKGIECAWRILDAQYWGVAQRRRRLFLIADFRGKLSAKILFKPESVSRDIEESESAKKESAVGIKASIGKSSKIYDITNSHSSEVICIPINDKATRYKGGGLTRKNDGAGNGLGIGKNGDPAPTLTRADRHAIFRTYSFQRSTNMMENKKSHTLSKRDYKRATDLVVKEIENPEMIPQVRKLTPLECERLQGLPEQWTLIADESCTDSARYRAIGNGMAQPCPDFIIKSMVRELKLEELKKSKENDKNV